jgi:hypothetical protein
LATPALATASFRDRQITCDAPTQVRKGTRDELNVYRGALDSSSAKPSTITCSTEAPLEIEIHPIWYQNEILGSGLTVAERGTRTNIAGVVVKRDEIGRNWSRAYWTSHVCSAGS